MMYETILSPIHYGGMQLKNRIIFAPTTFGLSDEEYLAKIRAIAQGGCAMIIVGDVPVGKSRFEKSLFDTKGFAFYQQVVKIAHDADCKVCAQLHQSDSNLLAMFKYIPGLLLKKITPDQLREKLNAEVAPYITKMSKRKIRTIISGFGKAAVLAKQAGFDMMQVHGDRMCGSFSSAIFNHRTDEYGGSAENRARFAAEAVSAVHAAVPGMPIDYKLAVRQENPHFGNAGVVEEELPVFVPLLEQAGVTSFHVTLANHSALENTIPPADHPYFSQPGCFLKFCDEVRQYTDLPICGVGGLNDPDLVEQQLASGRIQCAAMSRQLLADPDWVSYAIVYSSKTGNTKILADTLHDCLPQEGCDYFGIPDPAAMEADTLYVGFWTDKGNADEGTSDFLKQLHGKNIFLFGTAGFGGSKEYFDKILKKVEHSLDKSNTVFGCYMCQGKMPMSVRQRYEEMKKQPIHLPNLDAMIENFDKALSHPDADDLEQLKQAVR